MLAPCSGIRGGPRKIARPGLARTIAYQEFDFISAYVMALFCFMLLLCQGSALFFVLAPGFLEARPPPGAACDLLGEAAAPQAGSRQHKATHKLA